MACSTGGCESGCYREYNQEENLPTQEVAINVTVPNGNGNGVTHQHNNLCLKCKVNEIIGAGGGGGGDVCRFCADCFRINTFGKFKFAVTSNAMISPSDKVLVAFSGGPSSRVVLQFVHEMQHKALKNFDASRDRSLPVFGVGVAFIDESSICPVPSHEHRKAIEDMRLIVSNLAPPEKEFHVAPIGSLYSPESADGKDRLKDLLGAVSDVTGKDDLRLHLRMLSLQKIAVENGYTKIVLGSCTSRIACHVLAATVKGKGYSLAADIQYVDARQEIPVVLPLRDCLSQELNMLCCLDSLKTVEVLNGPHLGINNLISSFLKTLQEENPSRECTIVRTAAKLTPFHFNKIPDTDDCNVLSARRRQKKYNLKTDQSLISDSFCPICYSPLSQSDLINLHGENGAESFWETCCSSCQFQILPKESSDVDQFYTLLPTLLVPQRKDHDGGHQRRLREQIQDCLLSESEDGT